MVSMMIENYKRYLDRIERYKSFGYDIEWERRFIIEKSLPLVGNILEIGTGKGYLTLALAKEGFNFVSVDIDSTDQEIAKLNLEYLGLDNKVDLQIGNGESLNFLDGSFEVIFSVNMLHHLTTPFKVMDEFIWVLSPRGKIVLSDFSQEGFEMINRIHMSEGRIHKVTKIGLPDMEEYLKGKGFNLEKYRSDFQEVLVASRQVMRS